MTVPSLTHKPQTVTQFDLTRFVSLSNQLDVSSGSTQNWSSSLLLPCPVVPRSSQETTPHN
ncbi:hypothetical protein MYX84_10885 [Acidobacteria bacterium AH-259-O06]|nr:hypothetical protein [Acidobacteria bacterium AH-259-O06]